MSVSVHGTNGLTFNDGSVQKTSALTGFRNRIINGDMRIDQRNAGSAISVTTPSQATTFVVDRMNVFANGTGTFSAQRSTTAPDGFTNSIVITVTTADTSITTTDHYAIRQRLEGYNISDLCLGTLSAKPFTISFWARSSIVGTYSVGITNFNGTGTDKTYTSDYTINTANTWEQKTINIPAVTSGSWGTGANCGMELFFCLAAGSSYTGTPNVWASSPNYYIGSINNTTSLIGTNGATFYITGVQLEAGSTATEFERRPYGTELALCQRYYWTGNLPIMRNFTGGTIAVSSSIGLPVTMRTTPSTVTIGSGTLETAYSSAISAYSSGITSGQAYTPGVATASAEL